MIEKVKSNRNIAEIALYPLRRMLTAMSSYCVIILLITSCTVTKKVKDGTTAYKLKQYAVAIDLLEEEYANLSNKGEKYTKAFYLAESYTILQIPDQAIKWFEKANKLQSNEIIEEKLAYAYKRNEQYEDAFGLFQKMSRNSNALRWRQEMDLCKKAITAKEKDHQVNMSTFSASSNANDYSPFFLDADLLVFTSDRDESIGGDRYKWTGNAFSDLFVINTKSRKVNNFDAILNSGANEGTATLTQDGNQIFFTRCESIDLRNQYCRIYFSQRPNGFWMEPEPLMFFDEQTNFAHPCLIEQDSVLIFTAAPAGGDGTYDLYYSERVDGGWSEPDLMPPSINSAGNEKFPTSFNDTLYFASDGLPGYGGYDIFFSVLDQGKWSPPVNLGIPINSGADDFGMAVDPSVPKNSGIELQGYFSSSRNVGTGDDIFFFSKQYETPEEDSDEPSEDNKEEQYNIYMSVRVVEVLHEDDDPSKRIIGKNPIPTAKVKLSSKLGEEAFVTNNKGRFITEAQPAISYSLLSEKSGFITSALELDTYIKTDLSADTTINVELPVERIIYDKEIKLSSIYYDYERWEIRKDARPSLDSLKNLLELNPQLNIELSSHTDCRGELDYNLELSQKRAESAVVYLIDNGISADRMVATGYGESKPIVDCECDDCTEAQHQLNRRTAFKIVK